jgi:hypothetical protein
MCETEAEQTRSASISMSVLCHKRTCWRLSGRVSAAAILSPNPVLNQDWATPIKSLEFDSVIADFTKVLELKPNHAFAHTTGGAPILIKTRNSRVEVPLRH